MDARKFVKTGGFLKKQELQREGPRALKIDVVEAKESYGSKAGDPDAEMELQLVFVDGSRLSLRTAANMRRLIRWFGNDTDTWVGRVVEAYFDPDVPNPKGGDQGGIRLQLPGKQPLSDTFVSDLEEQEA